MPADWPMAKSKKTQPGSREVKRGAKAEAKAPPKSRATAKAAAREKAAERPDVRLELSASRQFASWLAEMNASFAFTTYQAGKIFLIGLKPDGRLSVFERTFNRSMGLCQAAGRLYLSTLYQLWRFENILLPGQAYEGYDRVYLPINAHTTGDLDIHDIAVDGEGRVVFVNTLFSCLSVLDDRASFGPLWRPPFISKLAAEDRCHLNGLAMDGGKPKYVTAVAEADVADGWRSHRADGGIVMDVPANEIVGRGLSMPHSPRLKDGRLWLLNSGTGEVGTLDPTSGKFSAVAFCPGYLRGFDFIGPYAVVGLSKMRRNRTFEGLALDDALAKRKAEAQCAIYVIDTRTGDAVHWLKIEGIISEFYDVVMLPGARRPMAFGTKSDEIRRAITIGVQATV